MKYFFNYSRNILKKISNKHILLFLDYDGTLTPIRKIPAKAKISQEIKKILFKLSKAPKIALSIISGRSINDIKKLVGLKNIVYSGDHGFQIEGNKLKYKIIISTEYKNILKQIKQDLKEKLNLVKGIIIENKDYGVSVHYRLVNKKDRSLVKNIFQLITKKYLFRKKIKIKSGKMVFEILPPIDWDKGKAVLYIFKRYQSVLENRNIFSVYIGDDITDEDAFNVLIKKGLTIFIGKPYYNSNAKFFLKNIKEVKKFLISLLEIRSKNAGINKR